MDNYEKALNKAVDYIMSELDQCQVCINREPCKKQYEIYDEQGKAYEPNRNLCKDSIKQYFIRQAEVDNGKHN